jgi:hypothetical protein
MANIDNSNTGLTESHAEEEPVNASLSSSSVPEEHSVVAACALKTSSSPPLISPTNSSTQSRTLLALPTSDPSFAAPHPKKFTSVNINKKFLQKNSSSSGSATTSLNHVPIVKSGSPARKFNVVFHNINNNVTPCSCPTCSSTNKHAFTARDHQAHSGACFINHNWSRLVASTIRDTSSLFNTINFIQWTPSAAPSACRCTSARFRSSCPTAPCCWQSHSATTTSYCIGFVRHREEGYCVQTGLGASESRGTSAVPGQCRSLRLSYGC